MPFQFESKQEEDRTKKPQEYCVGALGYTAGDAAQRRRFQPFRD